MMKRALMVIALTRLVPACAGECKELGATWCQNEFQQVTCKPPVKFDIGNQEFVRDCRLWSAVCSSGQEGGRSWGECTVPGETCAEEGKRECRGATLVTCRRGLWVVAPCMACVPDPSLGPRCN